MIPLFSIVIPTFNRAKHLEKAVDSVLSQEFRDFELIVVDDGSTDETEKVVQSIIEKNSGQSISYIRQKNSERAAARNNGLKNSKGRYVLFFDSDDTLYPNHLSIAREMILRLKNPEFFHLRYDIKNEKGQVTGEAKRFPGPPNAELILGNFLSCNGVFVRKDVADKNLFNENRALSGMEDWELWLRLASSYPLHYSNEITSSVINHDERSVLAGSPSSLIKKVTVLMELVLGNKGIQTFYAGRMNEFRSSCYSYISLHLALGKNNRREVLGYLWKSVVASPSSVFRRRSLAILKHLF
jgi:glycosyltransferase involved in cell wall biosynthesis